MKKKNDALDRKLEIINYTEKNSGKKQNLIAGHFNINSMWDLEREERQKPRFS